MLDRPAAALATPVTAWPSWRAALLALGAALAAWGYLFATEVTAAVRIWDSSTAYNHCWLILPIAAWLGWQRRARLVGLAPAPSPAVLLALLPLGLGWLAAERLGIMEGRQLAALAMAIATAVAVLGLRFGRAFAAPLAYLVFLVPFGAFTVPALQRITARMIEFGLGFTGIPHFVDDIIIEIPAGTFLVAEACAGLRFLIAAIAFGALYALVMFRSPGRRLAVLALSVIVPILANGLRGFGLVIIGHVSGNAAAVDADHLLYGWVFFSIVILLLILAGLPFRQDGAPPAALPPPDAPPPPARGPAAFAGTAALALALVAAWPIAADALDGQGAEAPEQRAATLAAPPGCRAEAEGALLRCEGWVVTARLTVFAPGANWSAVVAELWRLGGGGDVDTTFRVAGPDGTGRWAGRQSRDGSGARAVAVWRDGRPAGQGLRDRAAQAWGALAGGGARPVVAGVEIRPESGGGGTPRERDMLARVLLAQQDGLAAQAAALSRGR